MRKTSTVAISIALLGVAMTILAWIAAPERIDWEVKNCLFLLAVVLVVTAIGLPIWAFWFERQRRNALDGLSNQIDWAIHHLLNRPRPAVEEMPTFADVLRNDYDEWCRLVDAELSDKSFFAHSDLIRFQRLGFVDPVMITGHGATDRILGMLRLKLARLQEVIDSVQQRP